MQYLVDGVAIQWQMQAGITNCLSDTFHIYSPNKNDELYLIIVLLFSTTGGESGNARTLPDLQVLRRDRIF